MKKTGTGRYGNGIFPIIRGIMGWIRVTNRETSLGPITGGNKGGVKSYFSEWIKQWTSRDMRFFFDIMSHIIYYI